MNIFYHLIPASILDYEWDQFPDSSRQQHIKIFLLFFWEKLKSTILQLHNIISQLQGQCDSQK